jgi:hypothetical protein
VLARFVADDIVDTPARHPVPRPKVPQGAPPPPPKGPRFPVPKEQMEQDPPKPKRKPKPSAGPRFPVPNDTETGEKKPKK